MIIARAARSKSHASVRRQDSSCSKCLAFFRLLYSLLATSLREVCVYHMTVRTLALVYPLVSSVVLRPVGFGHVLFLLATEALLRPVTSASFAALEDPCVLSKRSLDEALPVRSDLRAGRFPRAFS